MTPDEPHIPGYEVVGLIDIGGTAAVWRMRAEDADDSDDDVAVKIFPRDATVCGREEWRQLRSLSGEHLLSALDLTMTDDGRPALVVPYCAGGSLGHLVATRGPLTAGELTSALTPVARALSQLHRQGVVHADIHPKNVLFTARGEAVLADLGAARAVGDGSAATQFTRAYTAPEIFDGEPPSPAADVYSFGATCWFALTGGPPPPAAMRPWLADLVDDVGSSTCELITAALSLTPSARPAVGDLVTGLGPSSTGVPVPLPDVVSELEVVGPVTRRRREVAVQHEQERRAISLTVCDRTRRGAWRNVLLAVGGGAVLVVAAVWLPVPGDHSGRPQPPTPSPKQVRTTSPARSGQVSSSGATRTPPRIEPPSPQEIGALLTCRARAWTAADTSALRGCLADRSQALGDDEARLREAARRRITYTGLSFSVGRVHQVLTNHGKPTVRLTVSRSAYRVTASGRVTSVPAQEVEVRLTFDGGPGRWKISGWNVV